MRKQEFPRVWIATGHRHRQLRFFQIRREAIRQRRRRTDRLGNDIGELGRVRYLARKINSLTDPSQPRQKAGRR